MQQEDDKKNGFLTRKRGRQLTYTLGIITALIFHFFEFIPFKLASIVIGNLFFNLILSRFSSPTFEIDAHAFSTNLALLPFVIVLSKPEEIFLARITTIGGSVAIVLGGQSQVSKPIYLFLSLTGWIIALIYKNDIGLIECDADRFLEDTILLVVSHIYFTVFVSVQSTNLLKATQQSVEMLKKLNELNKKANDSLKDLLQEKDSFLLLFSHETRNPLNILLGNITLLMEEANNLPSIKSKLIRCKFCAELLLFHLNNILDTGKLTNTGSLEVTPIPIRTYEYIQSTLNFMEMLVKKKGLKPSLIISSKLPPLLKFDNQRLTQVILNMLTNAVKFTKTGSVSLHVSFLKKIEIEESDFRPSSVFGHSLLQNEVSASSLTDLVEDISNDRENYHMELNREIMTVKDMKESFLLMRGSILERETPGFLKLEINDTGCGIKVEDISKLFKKFSQTHADGASRQIGTGLGLWISKTLCELMGGDVKVYSKLGVGTCFVVIIQAVSLPATMNLPKVSSSSNQESRNAVSQKILIADDDQYNRELHSQLLRGMGFSNIVTVMDGQKLIDTFKSKPEGHFEVIITEVNLPIVDGIEALRVIREFEHAQNRNQIVKVGFITGQPNHKDKDCCLRAPLNAWFYMPKPVTSSMLEGFISSIATQGKPTNPEIATRKPTILCVDDDLFNLEFLVQLIKSEGGNPLHASSGEQALEIVKSKVIKDSETINLILMDCVMDGMDGWTASRKIKDLVQEEGVGDIPLVGLTGESKQRNQEKFDQSGMDDMIQKPLIKDDLVALLKKYK